MLEIEVDVRPKLQLQKLKDIRLESPYESGETNLNLEDNAAIRHLWKRFKHETVKRRRAYVKALA